MVLIVLPSGWNLQSRYRETHIHLLWLSVYTDLTDRLSQLDLIEVICKLFSNN